MNLEMGSGTDSQAVRIVFVDKAKVRHYNETKGVISDKRYCFHRCFCEPPFQGGG